MPKQDAVVEDPPSILVKLAREYNDLRAVVEEKEEALKKLKEEKDSAAKKLVDEMTTQAIKSFKTEFGGFRTQAVVYPNVKDREALNSYVVENKLDWLYTTMVNGTKLKSWVRELMEAGKPIPPGLDPYTAIEVRRF